MLSQLSTKIYHGPGVGRLRSPSKLTPTPPACGMHPDQAETLAESDM
jgi:hypothetical protein